MRISDWSSDVCSSDLIDTKLFSRSKKTSKAEEKVALEELDNRFNKAVKILKDRLVDKLFNIVNGKTSQGVYSSEVHTSELQSLMRISYAVFCLKNTTTTTT